MFIVKEIAHMSANEAAAKAPQEIVVGKNPTGYVRYASKAAVPDDVSAVSEDDLTAMSKEELESLYSSLAGGMPKKFKNPKVALENVLYQIDKMPLYEEKTAQVVAASASQRKYERKSPNKYTLLMGEGSDKAMKDLAPQARECVSIMGDFAKELGRLEFGEDELRAKFEASADRLDTKQDPWRILQYYRGKLIGSNLLRIS